MPTSSSQCMACFDSESESTLVHLPCGEHCVCHSCLKDQVRLAVQDEGHYPLTCGGLDCSPIPNETASDALCDEQEGDSSLHEAFQEKIKEYSVPIDTRTYCANPECALVQGHSRFLDPEILGEEQSVLCPDCSGVTCRLCKALKEAEKPHTCKFDEMNAAIPAFIQTLSEDERWLWQQCYSCKSWVNKSEACNHMTCRCNAEFCLICGREWIGLASCRQGCPKNERPVYDEEGYNQNGFNPHTGQNREGAFWNANYEHEQEGAYEDDNDYDYQDDQSEYGDDGFNGYGFDFDGFGRDGFDNAGFSREGIDRDGYDYDGFDGDGFNAANFSRQGVNRDGYNYEGYNAAGFDRQGFRKSGLDAEGYFKDGFDLDGFDRLGMSLQNVPRSLYDEDGYDANGLSPLGYFASGYDIHGRDGEGYDVEGYDEDGFDSKGWNKKGYNTQGYDRWHKDAEGYLDTGYNYHHRHRDGHIQEGYSKSADGNVHLKKSEREVSSEVVECDHRTHFERCGARCVVCLWESDIFHRECDLCRARLCRACSGDTNENRRRLMWLRYYWPGGDSFGIAEMFEREGESMEMEEPGQTLG